MCQQDAQIDNLIHEVCRMVQGLRLASAGMVRMDEDDEMAYAIEALAMDASEKATELRRAWEAREARKVA